MADPTTYSSEEKDKKKLSDDRAKAQVEPVPSRLDFFEWLEKLFWQEPDQANFPEKIDVCPVSGPKFQRYHHSIMQKVWIAGQPKPPRAKIVEISNEILYRCQADCDIQRKRTVYSVNIWHFARDQQPYERWLLDMKPGQAFMLNGTPRADTEDEETSLSEKFSGQVLGHHAEMFKLYGGGYEALLDRFDRDKERDASEIERLRRENRELREQLERALSLEVERAERREWAKFKVGAANRAAEIGFGLAPSVLGRLLGQGSAGSESSESLTLKPFFKPREEGGLLTPEQSDALFGVYDQERNDEKGNPFCIRSGLFSFAQAKLLFDVSQCKVPADDLDKLLPDGPLAISTDQFMKLQSSGLGPEVLAPLFATFEPRLKKWSERQNGAGKNGTPT